ncbi:MAG: methyltransferase domain-containing protein [Aeromicrobium erythreum]
MTTWDPSLYLRHADERGRPFAELLARVPVEARTVVDLGCGAGNLTATIRDRWPDAGVVGVDSSPEMVERARADDPDGTYVLADVSTWEPDEPVDAIVSNAMFQWLPDRLDVIDRLLHRVAPGGALALQVPSNFDAPSHRILAELGAEEPYADHTAGIARADGTSAGEYLTFFAERGWSADVWETTYQHVLPGEDAVWGWISGTGARPFVQALPDSLREQFIEEYKARLRVAYPREPWGTVLPFSRVFAVATRLPDASAR